MADVSPHSGDNRLTIGQCAAVACFLEATVAKPGNVHRGADFEDLTYPDLVLSGIAIAPVLEAATSRRLGATILAAVQATQAAVATNSNLGMILLLAPLASVPTGIPLREGLAEVLQRLDRQDAALVYEAIRQARPGGLGKVQAGDVAGPPPEDLIAAMRLAADRDLVARQYAEDFHDVFDFVLPRLVHALKQGLMLGPAIVHVYLQLMSQFPDSLIARKCGRETAQRCADLAAQVLSAGEPGSDAYEIALADFDFWLRSDGHRRNPGTSADLIAAGLFIALRDGLIRPPYRLY